MTASQASYDGAERFVRCRGAEVISALWIDESADRVGRAKRGETTAAPRWDQGLQRATRESLLAVVRDYDRYHEIDKPVVADSKSLAADGNGPAFSMIWHRRVLFVDVAIQGWFLAQEGLVDLRRGYNIVGAALIQQIKQQIKHYRRASERLLPPDSGDGFMWRVQRVIRFVQRDGGVHFEIEAMTLTRDIPAGMVWLVAPVVRRLSANSLATTFEKTRRAIVAPGAAAVVRVEQDAN